MKRLLLINVVLCVCVNNFVFAMDESLEDGKPVRMNAALAQQAFMQSEKFFKKKDWANTVKFLALAAKNGHSLAREGLPEAQRCLACQREKERKIEEARGLFKEAASAGCISSMNRFANMLWDEGQKKEAKHLMGQAADRGLVIAMCTLGTWHLEESRDVNVGSAQIRAQWRKQARYRFKQAAKKSDPRAMNDLGLMYIEEKKYGAAQRWLQRAVSKGSPQAIKNLKVLLSMKEEEKAPVKMAPQEAADLGDFNADEPGVD